MPTFIAYVRDRSSTTSIEYALVASLVAVAGMAAFSGLGAQIRTLYADINEALQRALIAAENG